MQSGSAMLSSILVPASRCARVPSSCVQPIAASIGTFVTCIPCGISSFAMLCASPDLAWHAIAKAPLNGKPLRAALALVKMMVPFAPLALVLVFLHESSCLLTHQKRAECGVANCIERHARVSVRNPFTKDASNPAVNVVHDKSRSPKVSNYILEEQI